MALQSLLTISENIRIGLHIFYEICFKKLFHKTASIYFLKIIIFYL